jgi:glucose-6-phosphate isomerase/transaldolase/glucose-6-phosphate isomerase
MINLADIKSAFQDIDRQRVIERLWQRDYTLWKPDPSEISNRLGWLAVTDAMRIGIPYLKSFARDIKNAGCRHVVLLGMGGSSLGAEVLEKAIGQLAGYPRLTVLDSTLPEAVKSVEGSIDIQNTLFLVASKSGTTIEPLTLYRYFRGQVESVKEVEQAGENFVAITDPGTPLDTLAREEKFRRAFLNPEEVGGRYSVLSYFGLVPAALLGIDITRLIERADAMREKCRNTTTQDNPGAWLGTIMGVMGRQGRDKLTLVTSPSLASTGLWIEQLIAESTGKEGKGIVPVAGEPVLTPEHYGEDRLFVYLRLKTDDNTKLDAAVDLFKHAGQPVVTIDLADNYDLGAEFYRWEFAIAVAGVLLGINPFDQPDVEGAKAATQRVLGEFTASQRRPELKSDGNLSGLLSSCRAGDYLSIMAYLRETPETDRAFTRFRRRIAERFHIATTLGYGPRFLHSTGQLYKGGPNTGLFIQLTAAHDIDIPVPGKPYTFGVLADAEAMGDKEALQAAGRRVISIHLNVPEEDIARELLSRLTY